uniref:PAX-interacting protein 1 n=1 Tax=Culicoides sonorensis TaxID=179676 RepID=A0A336MGK1_CULSO
MATATSFSFDRLINNLNAHIEQPVRHHLAKVYCCLFATCAAAGVGSFVHLSGLWEAGLLSAFGSLGLVLGLAFTPDNGKNFYQRLAMLLGFGVFTGHSMGILLQFAIFLNPAIIVTALMGTTIIFVCLSVSALFAQRGKYLFLGGMLMSMLSTMLLISLSNLLFRSQIVNDINLYLGLAVMCGLVLYDTQAIMEKCRMGNKDAIQHSLDLFYDVVNIFRKLLVILMQKSALAILSDGESSFSLFSGITIIGTDVCQIQYIKFPNEHHVEHRHAAIRVDSNGDKKSAEIMDLFTDYGTKIDGESIRSGEWKCLQTDEWISFGTKSLKFSFTKIEDESDVISASPETVPIRRRQNRSMRSQMMTQRRSNSLSLSVLAPATQFEESIKDQIDQSNMEEEEYIPETQQPPVECSVPNNFDEIEEDSEFVHVEPETELTQAIESQIIINTTFKDNSHHGLKGELSTDRSMSLHLNVTPSQQLPDIFKETEDIENESALEKLRNDSVTPDVEDLEPDKSSAKSPAATLTSLASTESKTTVDTNHRHEFVITPDIENQENCVDPAIYEAATQKFNDVDASVESKISDENESSDSDTDIFFAPTQLIPTSGKSLHPSISYSEAPKNNAFDNIYEVATQAFNPETDLPEASTTKDDNIYDALTQPVPQDYLTIQPTPTPKLDDSPPPSQPDTDDSDTDFATAPTMIISTQQSSKANKSSKKMMEEAGPSKSSNSDDCAFYDSLSQLTSPITPKVKEQTNEQSTPKGSRSTIISFSRIMPQANSTAVKNSKKSTSKRNEENHTNSNAKDDSLEEFSMIELNTPDCLNLPPVDQLMKPMRMAPISSSQDTYFFESRYNAEDSDTDEIEIPEIGSHARLRHKQIIKEPSKKNERCVPKPKLPIKVENPLETSEVNVPSKCEPKKRALSDSGAGTSREPSSRKRVKPTKLAEDFITESQMDDYKISRSKKRDSDSNASPLAEKSDTFKNPPPPKTRKLKVVVKPVACVATALPAAVSPEEKPKNVIGKRKRKAVSKENESGTDTETDDKKTKEHPQKARKSPKKITKIKSINSTESASSSNETLATIKESLSSIHSNVKRTRSQDKQKVLFTMIDGKKYERKIKESGHSIAESISEATVLVTDKVYRSAKLLSAISRGIPIVSVKWFEESKRKLDLDINKYLLHDSTAEGSYKFSLRNTLEDVRENGPILKGYKVICSPNTKPYPREVKLIVESSGGEFSNNVEDYQKTKGTKYLLVATKTDNAFLRDAKRIDSKVKIIDQEAFMLTVMRNELVLDRKFLL